ncbi:MAG: hypothetical protein AAB512_02580 [Patescibacteria group bacterium]
MRKVNRIERLARREEKNIIKRIFFLSIISVILIFVIFTVGISALGKFADLVDAVFKNKAPAVKTDYSGLLAPILDSLPDATNSARLKISGFSSDGDKVEVYLQNEKVGETSITGGKFSYEDLTLSDGENELALKVVGAGGAASDLSSTVKIILDKKEPALEVSSPSDGQTFLENNRIKIEGETEKDAQVYANGFLANVSADGKFDVTIPLTEGENQIEVKALDEAGNAKIAKLKVNFKK